MPAAATQEKSVSITLEFKQVMLDMDDQKFASTLQETLDAVKSRMTEAKAKYAAAKSAIVIGVPTLAEKGVSIGVTITL